MSSEKELKMAIDRLRDKLNKRSETQPVLSDGEMLEISRRLDELIIFYYRIA